MKLRERKKEEDDTAEVPLVTSSKKRKRGRPSLKNNMEIEVTNNKILETIENVVTRGANNKTPQKMMGSAHVKRLDKPTKKAKIQANEIVKITKANVTRKLDILNYDTNDEFERVDVEQSNELSKILDSLKYQYKHTDNYEPVAKYDDNIDKNLVASMINHPTINEQCKQTLERIMAKINNNEPVNNEDNTSYKKIQTEYRNYTSRFQKQYELLNNNFRLIKKKINDYIKFMHLLQIDPKTKEYKALKKE